MAKFNPAVFVSETRNEVTKVTWPTRKETMMTTVMIVVMALVSGVFLFLVDHGLSFVIRHILGMAS